MAIVFVTLALILLILQIFGYDLSPKSLRELSEKRKIAAREGSYNPFKDPVVWIIWVILLSTGFIIAVLRGI